MHCRLTPSTIFIIALSVNFVTRSFIRKKVERTKIRIKIGYIDLIMSHSILFQILATTGMTDLENPIIKRFWANQLVLQIRKTVSDLTKSNHAFATSVHSTLQ